MYFHLKGAESAKFIELLFNLKPQFKINKGYQTEKFDSRQSIVNCK